MAYSPRSRSSLNGGRFSRQFQSHSSRVASSTPPHLSNRESGAGHSPFLSGSSSSWQGNFISSFACWNFKTFSLALEKRTNRIQFFFIKETATATGLCPPKDKCEKDKQNEGGRQNLITVTPHLRRAPNPPGSVTKCFL